MMTTSIRRSLGLLVMALWPMLAQAQSQSQSQSQSITVSAAASLTESFEEIGRRFEASHPGASLRFNFGASGALLQQIAQGAPVDVFASADAETMDRGVSEHLLDPATRRDFAANALVLVVPAGGPIVLACMEDLARPAVHRVAIGKSATVPAGRYARQALDAAGLWAAVEPKAVLADSVRQVLDYVAGGEVEAGFVYRTDAAVAQGRVRVIATPGAPVRAVYPVAMVADSRQRELSRRFIDFLSSGEAQAVLAKAGFSKP